VLSAVEGLNVATPAFQPVILPIAMVVLIGLFAMQHFGTGGIGHLFGPIMLIWFAILFVLGVRQIVQHPGSADGAVAAACLRLRHEAQDRRLRGAGRRDPGAHRRRGALRRHRPFRPQSHPRRLADRGVPALLANYYGQGALLLADPTAASNPFFKLAPSWALYPLVVVATMATVIASQATISGAFSMAQQATLLGLSPRARILHTSPNEFGQIYVPAVNWLQLLGVLGIVLAFKTGPDIASAYGIAVTGTMLITTMLVLTLAVRSWKWPWDAGRAAVPSCC
jgi:KUP system potassium uptake protein